MVPGSAICGLPAGIIKGQNLHSYSCTSYNYWLLLCFLQGQELRGNKMQQNEAVLTVGMVEAARRLGLSVRTIATLISRNELPSRKIGRRRLIAVCDLEAFVRCDHRRVGDDFSK